MHRGCTLEAELGIRANSKPEPDYLGWEVKQHTVSSFVNLPQSLLKRGTAITLMTPEPTGGVYVEEGIEKFIRRFGYADRTGRSDRINFGGKYVPGKPYHLNRVSMEIIGFDPDRDSFDGSGRIRLIRGQALAAEWKFADLLKHWADKHAKAVYVPSMIRREPVRAYRYSSIVRLGEGTDFLKFLRAVHAGAVYYDPGIKLENASTNPRIKRRSQFRILSGDLSCLYSKMSAVDARFNTPAACPPHSAAARLS